MSPNVIAWQALAAALDAASGLLFFISGLIYVGSIIWGQTRPEKASWLIWATLDTITLIGMDTEGSLNGLIIGSTSEAWIVVALAFGKYGKSGWTRTDKYCLGFVGAAIILWGISGNGWVGVGVSLIGTLVAAWPTWKAAWEDPWFDSPLAWNLGLLADGCAIAVVWMSAHTWQDWLQPVIFGIRELVMVWLLGPWRRPQSPRS